MSLVFGFIFSGCSDVDINKEVATVNGEKITVREYNFFLWTVKERMELEAYKENVENFWDTEIEGKKAVDVAKEKALEAAVKNKIELQKAKELGLSLTESELKEITEQKKAYVNSWGGKENYQKLLKEKGLSDKSFTEILEKLKISEKLYKKVTSEGTEYNISEQEMKDYYEKNKEQLKVSKVRAKHILLSIVDENKKPLPQEKQDEAKKKAEEVYAKVKAGEDFDKLMKEYSQDPGLKDYPEGYTFSKDEPYAEEFKNAAFSLEKGGISDIVKTDFGYHIIKVEDKFDEYYSFDQVKEGIKQYIIGQKYNDAVKKWKDAANIVTNEAVLKQIKVKTDK
jgi:foldase protein PrsA